MNSSFVWDWEFTIKMLPLLMQGASTTILLTVCAIFFGTIIGLIVALLKIAKNTFLNYLGGLYTWVFRGIPLLVQLFIIYQGLPMATGITLSPTTVAIIGLSLCGGAYIAEIIRGGVLSIDKGQMEAALSLGMSYSQAMGRIIIPQTYKRLLPPMGNEFISLLKDTSLVSSITMVELFRVAQVYSASFFKPFEMFITAGIMYLIMTTFFTVLFNYLERKLSISE